MNGSENTPPQHHEETNGFTTQPAHSLASDATQEQIVKQEEGQDVSCNGNSVLRKRKHAESFSGQRSSRAESPPWKKVAHDGPTSFVEEGKRRSARTNAVPLELQPQSSKRTTRASHQESSNKIKAKNVKPSLQKPAASITTPVQGHGKHTRTTSKSGALSNGKATPVANFKAPATTPTKRSHKKRGNTLDEKLSPTALKYESPRGKRRSGQPSRVKEEEVVTNGWHKSETEEGSSAAEIDDDSEEDFEEESDDIEDLPVDPNFKPKRLTFKVHMPSLSAQHPGHVPPPKRFSSLREWADTDLQHDGSDPRMSDEQIRKEARSRQRLFEAVQSGRLLNGLSSLDAAEPEEEPSRQYYRHDHLLAHVQDMRKRMAAEKRRHIREAKKLADDLSAYWKALQPKSEEDMQREKNALTEARSMAVLCQCVHDLSVKWEMIRVEVEKQRFAMWEEEQKALGKQALQGILQHSEKLLDARRQDSSDVRASEQPDADDESGEEEEAGLEDEGSVSQGDNEDNMSSSESEGDEETAEGLDNDEHLTVEELRRKYEQDPAAHVDRPPEEEDEDVPLIENGASSKPTEPPSDPHPVNEAEGQYPEELDESMLDESDESTDMDDDMGSSDEESTGDEEDDSEDAEDEPGGLYGFFSTKDLAPVLDEQSTTKLSSTNDVTDTGPNGGSYPSYDEEDELDEVSLIPDTTELQTPALSHEGSFMSQNDSRQEPGFTHEESSASSVRELDRQGEGPSQSLSQKHSEKSPYKVEDTQFRALQQDPEDLDQEPEDTEYRPKTPAEGRSQDLVQEIDRPADSDIDGERARTLSPPNETSAETQSIAMDQDSIMDTNTDSLPTTPTSSKPLKTAVPSLLRGTLREYQHYGLDWLAGLYANGTNGILADEMGLGKTIQTISLLAHLAIHHQQWGPHLIVVPTSVMLNWEMEFKKFLPGFKILTYYGTQEERKTKRRGWLDNDKWNAVITSYQLIVQDENSFKKRGWHYLILDEAHNIKNFRAKRWQAMLGLNTDARLLLTGTPLQNNLSELWSLMFFLMPTDKSGQGFAQLDEFSSWFKRPVDQILEQGREEMDDEAKQVVKRLHSVLRPYLLRRLKADVEKQMPAKYEHVVYCRLSKRQRHLYDGFMSRAQTRETLASGNYLSIINCLMQLRKVCNHPDLFETRPIVTSFAMPKSAIADYEIKELLVRRRLLYEADTEKVSLDVVDLLPGANGPVSALDTLQPSRLKAIQSMRILCSQQNQRIKSHMPFNGSSVSATLSHMDNHARAAAKDHLHHHQYLTSLRSQRRPLMNHGLIGRLTFDTSPFDLVGRYISLEGPQDPVMGQSDFVNDAVLDLPRRASSLENLVQKFACVTPAVVASDVGISEVSQENALLVRRSSRTITKDPYHEARMRLSIAFPDKRLLQYDCGKLQRLDTLLRTLQAGGHRALIFTQMTKVLDILEQFLNIHGHRYLRLDGSTKIEQRQIMTDRFNNDNRILAFILSSRSGGLGINLTGADTVIFYDLDWNPAMDKQCQDRCHRIGQTRDVHIYRFVSEYTIEANILRKANQKRLLDDVIIQEGDFTTDFFHKPNPRDAFEDDGMHEADAEASAAMDRVLGAGSAPGNIGAKIFEQAEDKEDIAAAHVAAREVHADDADFSERGPTGTTTPKTPGGPLTPGDMAETPGRASSPTTAGVAALELHRGVVMPRTDMSSEIFEGREAIGVDRHIVEHLEWELKDIPVGPPPGEKKKKKKGGEHVVKRKR